VSTNQLGRRESLLPLLLIGTSAAVMFAAGGGAAVHVSGMDRPPRWVWTTAVEVATDVAYQSANAEMTPLALVINSRLAVLGPNHLETHRSRGLLERRTGSRPPITPIEAWWR
jgi:hypothetical protein